MKMSEIRAKYPEYSDLPDEQLVIGLHRKFYSDMPFREFHKNVTYDVPNPKDKNDGLLGPLTPAQQQAVKNVNEAGWGTGIPKAAEKVGGFVTDQMMATGHSPETSAAVGGVGNFVANAVPAFGSSFRAAGEPIVSMLEKPARSMMQSALKPSQADLRTGDAGRAVGTMLQEGISPTSGGMNRASQMAQKLNDTTDQAISASQASVDIPAVISRLDPLRAKAAMQVNPKGDLAEIKETLSQFLNSPSIRSSPTIPVQLAQKLKSGTYAALGKKSYGEVGSSSTEAQKRLARGLREEVIAKVPEVAEPLKKESALRNVMDVSANRALQDANKNPLSLGTSIAAIMHDPLAAAGMWANASTPVKAMMARLLFSGGRPDMARPASIATQEALNRPKE